MEKLFGIYYHEAQDGSPIKHIENSVLIPVYGEIPCGEPNTLNGQIKGHIEIPNKMLGMGDYFVLQAKGSSMIGAGIEDGDLVIVKKQDYADESQIVVAFVDGETTLKRFYKNEKHQLIELRPENNEYKTIYADDCQILGVAVKIIKDLI